MCRQTWARGRGKEGGNSHTVHVGLSRGEKKVYHKIGYQILVAADSEPDTSGKLYQQKVKELA